VSTNPVEGADALLADFHRWDVVVAFAAHHSVDPEVVRSLFEADDPHEPAFYRVGQTGVEPAAIFTAKCTECMDTGERLEDHDGRAGYGRCPCQKVVELERNVEAFSRGADPGFSS
jgi:hypothetical protein